MTSNSIKLMLNAGSVITILLWIFYHEFIFQKSVELSTLTTQENVTELAWELVKSVEKSKYFKAPMELVHPECKCPVVIPNPLPKSQLPCETSVTCSKVVSNFFQKTLVLT